MPQKKKTVKKKVLKKIKRYDPIEEVNKSILVDGEDSDYKKMILNQVRSGKYK